jgi:microcystin-dependent protein
MKKLLPALLLALLLHGSAPAAVPCSVPNQIKNGDPADATIVMANFNTLAGCFANAASAGVNTDITALQGLTAPIPPSGGGTPNSVATTAATINTSVTPNTITIAATNPANFLLIAGRAVTFQILSGINNGAVTLQVGTTPATAVHRQTYFGHSPTVGGEFVGGNFYSVWFDGTEFQIVGREDFPGEMRDWANPAGAPAGWAIADGSCLSTTTFADLFSAIGTTYNPGTTCGGGTFALPDTRGRAVIGQDLTNLRISAAACPTAVGAAGPGNPGNFCGAQNQTLTQANLPVASLSAAGLSVSGNTGAGTAHFHSVFSHDSLHAHGPASGTSFLTSAGGGGLISGGGASGASGTTTTVSSNNVPNSAAGGVGTDNQTATENAHTHALSGLPVAGTVPTGGSGTPVIVLQPMVIALKIIKL